MVKVRATRSLENALRRWGFHLVAGCDEVGRGCLAVPSSPGCHPRSRSAHSGLFDSKMTTLLERERSTTSSSARRWPGRCVVAPSEIDRINIHRASLDAMRQAVGMLVPRPTMVVVDPFGFRSADGAVGVPKGDRKVSAVAAASIVAKVTRDREMQRHHEADPRYGYDRHKGMRRRSTWRPWRSMVLGPARRSFKPRRCLIRLSDAREAPPQDYERLRSRGVSDCPPSGGRSTMAFLLPAIPAAWA
jgi:ribonuclease HII